MVIGKACVMSLKLLTQVGRNCDEIVILPHWTPPTRSNLKMSKVNQHKLDASNGNDLIKMITMGELGLTTR